jgi:hypothetical protein
MRRSTFVSGLGQGLETRFSNASRERSLRLRRAGVLGIKGRSPGVCWQKPRFFLPVRVVFVGFWPFGPSTSLRVGVTERSSLPKCSAEGLQVLIHFLSPPFADDELMIGKGERIVMFGVLLCFV